ncbi:MAG: glycerol-3-phosphate 1-O-acyltransferase PlsB [Natronospirillum sp.]
MYGLLKRLMATWIRFDNRQDWNAPELQADTPVIYVLQRQSLADCMAADLFLRRHGMPVLRHLGRDRPLIFLEHKRLRLRQMKRRQQPTPLQSLCQEVYEQTDKDYQLVPVNVFWGRTPTKEKSIFKLLFSDRWTIPGPVRKFFTVLFNGRATFIEVSAPVSLRQLSEGSPSQELTSRKAHRILRVHFNRVRKRVIGPDLSHRRTLLTQIVHSAAVRQAITQQARSKKTSLEKARQTATRYLEEIMADISYPTIRFLDLLLSRLWNRIYNGIKVNNIDVVKAAAQDSALVYVPCHRSHIDYLLLSYSLFHQGLTIPHIAAGKNLNMPLIGPLLRRGGAFFMRRSFRGDKLYTTVFNEYLNQMFSRGIPVEYFVEGGRSRTGRTLQPKAGMLSMTLKSFLREDGRPLKFVPVYIGYEKVFEANSYLKELRGRQKQSESFLGLLKTVRRLKNYGTVSLNFGQPIDLADLLQDIDPNWRACTAEPEQKPKWTPQAIERLSGQIAERINASAALNPVNMIAMVLLSSPRNALDKQGLEQQANLYLTLLRQVPYSAEVTFPEGSPQDWLDQTVRMSVVQKIVQPLSDIYTLGEHHAVLMTYYRNNIIHLFAVPSLLCCGLQVHGTAKTRTTVLKQLALIYPYVRNELFLHWSETDAQVQANHYLTVLIEQGLIVETDGELSATSEPDKLVQFMALGRIMLPTLERYYLTLATLNANGQSVLSMSALESKAQEVAQLVAVLNGLNAPEFFDKVLFKQFVQTLREKAVIYTDHNHRICFDKRISDGLAAAESLVNPELVRNVRWITQQPH